MDIGTDWVTVGARVAEYTNSSPDSVRLATVARVTASQVVLDNGSRYRRKDGREVGDSARGPWACRTDLRPLDDSQVRQARVRQVVAAVEAKVERIVKEAKDIKADADSAWAALGRIELVVAAGRRALADID